MRTSLLFLLMVAISSDASAYCICVLGPIHIYSSGAAICFAKRYEDGDCTPGAPGQCQFPSNVYQYRIKGTWEHCPEDCPDECQPFRMLTATAAEEGQDCACGTEEADAGALKPGRPVQPEGLPVKTDFHPLKAMPRRLPQDAEARRIRGVFTFEMTDKIATNIDSDSTIAVGQDINVLVFGVTLAGQEEQFVAYEVTGEVGQPTKINARYITNVRYQPSCGDRVLTLQISDPRNLNLKGKTLHLLRGPAPTQGESAKD